MSGKISSVYSEGFMASCGFHYTNIGDESRCKHCHLEISNWTLDMNPLEIHSEKSPTCPFILERNSPPSPRSNYSQICENDTIQEVRIQTFSHFESPLTTQLIKAGFFYCNIADRVICIYCNLICHKWNIDYDNPSELHRTLSPNCTYVQTKLTDFTPSTSLTDTIDNAQTLTIPDQLSLGRLVQERMNNFMSQEILKKYFNLEVMKRCWEDQLQLKQRDFTSGWHLFIACLILQKQIKYFNDKEGNIIIPSITMETNFAERRNWKEDRQLAQNREVSLTFWPHKRPSPIQMLKGGWFSDQAKGNDYARCVHCKYEHSNWQPADDPFNIHRDLAPNCPFIFATQPLHQNSVPIKSLGDIYTDEEIQTELTNGNPRIILPSSSNKSVVDRISSFGGFRPQLSDNMIHALAKSGFFYTGIGTLIQCYMCSLPLTNFHQYSVDQINREHCKVNSNCRYAKFMVESDNLPAPDPDSRCHWCFDGSKELVIFRCLHFAVCKSCSEWISVCSTCGQLAEAFFHVYC